MGQSHPTPYDEENSRLVTQMWEKLSKIPGLTREQAIVHLLYIIRLAEPLRIVKNRRPRERDVICYGIADDATVIGVSSNLRSHLAAEVVRRGDALRANAFDGNVSRLEAAAVEDGVDTAARPIVRDLGSCAEPVVFEKLGRMNSRANYTYSLQRINGRDGTVKIVIVKRCSNCLLLGGAGAPAPAPGGPFGITPRLGVVVTDHPDLSGLVVPTNTRLVMLFLRHIISGLDNGARQNIEHTFPSLRVWRNETKSKVFSLLGPNEEIISWIQHQYHEL